MRTLDSLGHLKQTPEIATGIIIIFSGAVVPEGYVLCDGTNQTPDLRDRFIVGASAVGLGSASGSVSATTGLTHAGAAVGAHSAHAVTQPTAHPSHVVTQPGSHSDHVVTQASAHSDHALNATHTHDSHTTSTATVSATSVIADNFTHSADGAHDHDAHSPHALHIVDDSGNGRHGVITGVNVPTFVASPWSGFGQALDFPGEATAANGGLNCGPFGVNPAAFCVETRFRVDALTAGIAHVLCGQFGTIGGNFLLWVNGSTNVLFASLVHDDESVTALQAVGVSVGVDYIVAASWDGTNYRLFIGTSGTIPIVDSAVPGKAVKAASGVEPWRVGYDGITTVDRDFNGIIDELRVSNVVRRTAAYTADAAPFADDANTDLLLHMEPQTALDAHSAHTGAALDAHSAHSATALDGHSAHGVTQPSTHAVLKHYILAYAMKT